MSAFLNIIILLGALQGFIVSMLLYTQKVSRLSNRILAVLIFLIALPSLKIYMNNNNWFAHVPYAGLIDAFVPFFIIMAIGPLIFFYVQASCDPGFRIRKQQRTHFIPILLDLVPQIIALIYVTGALSGLIKPDNLRWGLYIDTWNVYADIPRWSSITLYLWLSVRYLKQRSQQPAIPLRWLQLFLRIFLVFQAIWLVYLVPYVIPALSNKLLNIVDWYPIYIPLSIMIYWLGIRGYIISYPQVQVKKKATGTAALLPEEVVQSTRDILCKTMEHDKLYLDPALDLSLLARHTGIAPKTISAVLNQHLHKSFNEFVNGYRVQAIKERLLQPENRQLTIAGMAYEVGFNSLPTFQRAFKSVTGLSPSEFIIQHSTSAS